MNKWDDEFSKNLIHSKNYRDFLNAFFQKESSWSSPKPVSYSVFAERAQISSRGYMNDIIRGRKRLTPSFFDRVVKGLKLTQVWRNYLLLLTQREESALWKISDLEALERKIQTAKSNLLKHVSVTTVPNEDPLISLMLNPNFSEVYASLGHPDRGATVKVISKRSRLASEAVNTILIQMKDRGLVGHDPISNKYFVKNIDLQTNNLNFVFEKDFHRAAGQMISRSKSQMSSKSSLFMTQTFSVASTKLPALKIQLRDLINQFAVDSEDSDGDCVSEICIGFTNNTSAPPVVSKEY